MWRLPNGGTDADGLCVVVDDVSLRGGGRLPNYFWGDSTGQNGGLCNLVGEAARLTDEDPNLALFLGKVTKKCKLAILKKNIGPI